MERELTLVTVFHPDMIEGWQRVDHPVLGRLAGGDATLGWEGDPRLVVYLHLESQTFALWRLEADGEYRPVAHLSSGQVLGEQEVSRLLKHLVEIDQRNGYDPAVDILARRDARERRQTIDTNDRISAFADKLLYGLSRSHLPSVDVTYIRNAPSRR